MDITNTGKAEQQFWNDEQMTAYFAAKPADPRVEERLRQIPDIQGKVALDLGCGGGRHTELLCQLGFDTYGCDVNPGMIGFTRNRIAGYYPNEDITHRVMYGSILTIPFADETFDALITTGVLHQAKSLEEYRQAIHELVRVMKRCGVVTLNIFTNAVWDDSYTPIEGHPYTVITREGLPMTLLPKELFYTLMEAEGLQLETELAEDIKLENTGPRAVLRSNFIKL